MGNDLIKKQQWVMHLLTAFYLIIAWLIASQFYFHAFDGNDTESRIAVIVVGIILFVLAIALYIPSRFAITSNCKWSGVFQHGRDKLITRGPYKYVRHPEYSSYFVAGIATGFILTDSTVLIFIISLIPLIYLKAIIKEQYLSTIFPEYNDYKKRTGMFF